MPVERLSNGQVPDLLYGWTVRLPSPAAESGTARPPLPFPDAARALDWLDAERVDLVALVRPPPGTVRGRPPGGWPTTSAATSPCAADSSTGSRSPATPGTPPTPAGAAEASQLIRANGYRVLEADALTVRAQLDAALGRPDAAHAATRAAADLRRALRPPT